jgi:hypothetical protein
MNNSFYHIGDIDLVKGHKTAFLCSRKIPASAVLKCYDWALAQREAHNCVISGFHSKLEKDVLHYLLKGTQPVIVALARGLMDQVDSRVRKAIDDGKLLMITPFEKKVKRVTEETAVKRNLMMVDLADEIVVGHANESGQLYQMLRSYPSKVKYL